MIWDKAIHACKSAIHIEKGEECRLTDLNRLIQNHQNLGHHPLGAVTK